MRVWLFILLVACGSKEQGPQAGSGSGPGSSQFEQLPAAEFSIATADIPDDPTWKRAVNIATRQWAESFNKLGVTSARVTAFKSPEGDVAPYLLLITASKQSEQVFQGVAMVSPTQGMINGGGMKRLEKHLASVGFPMKTKLALGHVVEMIYLANILRDWTRDVLKDGWAFDKPEPATLTYDTTGATLTLFRERAGVQKIEIRFDQNALITTTTYKQAGDTWERFTE